MDDIDDLFDDHVGMPAKKTTIATKSSALKNIGGSNNLYDFDDDNDETFDWAGGSKPKTAAASRAGGFGQSKAGSTSNARPPIGLAAEEDDQPLFGFGGGKKITSTTGAGAQRSGFGIGGGLTSSQGKLNSSFGGGSRGSAYGSRKS